MIYFLLSVFFVNFVVCIGVILKASKEYLNYSSKLKPEGKLMESSLVKEPHDTEENEEHKVNVGLEVNFGGKFKNFWEPDGAGPGKNDGDHIFENSLYNGQGELNNTSKNLLG